MLVAAFRHSPGTWDALDEARVEVREALGEDRTAFAALLPDRAGRADREGGAARVAGWIGAIAHGPALWELHPLAVRPELQGRGVGGVLVRRLEAAARAAGACTLWLGADDDFGGTNLFGQDLFPDVLGRLQGLAPRGRHPYRFYERLGFTVVGVLPDASGPGAHDILMAKRVSTGAVAEGPGAIRRPRVQSEGGESPPS